MGFKSRKLVANGESAVQTPRPEGRDRRTYVLETQPPFTPRTLAARWHFHHESVRRKFRRGEIAGTVVGRRILIPAGEVARLEGEGMVARAA
jgi:hypothetical protein